MDAWGLIIPGSIARVVFELGHKYTNINVYKNAHLIYYYFDSGRFGFDFGNIGALECCNGLNMKNAYGNNVAKKRLPYCGNR